jgi:DNA polymerase III delta prime subunit
MKARIGVTVDGQVVGFHSESGKPLLVVGDTGCGKTTTARYLTRWWLASTPRHAHVYAQAPAQWADLSCGAERLDHFLGSVSDACDQQSCLVVVDDVELLGDDRLAPLLGMSRVILTSHRSSVARRTILRGFDCVGLLPVDYGDSGGSRLSGGKRRMEWPIGTIGVIPDQRGPIDFPCHRWQLGTWVATPR